MQKVRLYQILAGALLCVSLWGGNAYADPTADNRFRYSQNQPQSHYNPPNRRAVPQWVQRKISAAEAKAIAMQYIPDSKQVVDVFDEGQVYRVRLIRSNGRVIDVYVDVMTGRVLQVS